MNRREAIRNSLMALAVSLVPKVLQPSVPEITQGEANKGFCDAIGFLDERDFDSRPGEMIIYTSAENIKKWDEFWVEMYRKQSIQ